MRRKAKTCPILQNDMNQFFACVVFGTHRMHNVQRLALCAAIVRQIIKLHFNPSCLVYSSFQYP